MNKYKFKIKEEHRVSWIQHINNLGYSIDPKRSHGEYIFLDGYTGEYFFGDKETFVLLTGNYEKTFSWVAWEGLQPFKLITIDEL